MRALQSVPKKSNLLSVLTQIEGVFNRFQKEPLEQDLASQLILPRFPKSLNQYSLMKHQIKDRIFRETFVYQTMIFLDCLKSPILNQSKGPTSFKIEEGESKVIDVMMARARSLLRPNEAF